MRQYTIPKIYYNKNRSFCFFYFNGKRIRIYNGKSIGENIYPNKLKNKAKVLDELNKLKDSLLLQLQNNWIPNNSYNLTKEKSLEEETSISTYEKSIFQERVNLEIYNNSEIGSKVVADEIAELIIKKQNIGKNCILGLATGSSPIYVYKELIRIHKNEGLSFKNVISFNLDEYVPMDPKSKHSYHFFMYESLFKHIDIKKQNIHIPKGDLEMKKIQNHCMNFEKKIKDHGGIDLQLLGIGRTGHIGFNEPGALRSSITRLTNIDFLTKFDAAEEFQGIENVPLKAITMGVQTILNAKKIILLAWGEGKRTVIKKSVEEQPLETMPASYLQYHTNTKFILDKDSSSSLKRISCPWFYTDITTFKVKETEFENLRSWNDFNIKKAVIWLSLRLKKPILFLTDRDYQENGMSKIFEKYDNAYNANIKVFNLIQNTITGWPGGKPNADESKRPERSKPSKKRCLIFSPHPDDDVISMGGTIERLVNQGHEVYIAYQVSGNIAVFNEDILQQIEIIKRTFKNIRKSFNLKKIINESNEIFNLIKKEIKNKNTSDKSILSKFKSSIRQAEAIQATTFLGVNKKNILFLNMPFYETGKAKKNELGKKDISIISKIIEKIKPHQIFAAGDLADPHGTHRLCLNSIFNSIDNLKKEIFMKNCYVWLYRGAWKEWKIYDIDMSVPLSDDQIITKRKSIFKHQTQKDSPVFPGSDTREFWQRAEERNAHTASLYKRLGLAQYQAMEAFKRHYF